MCNIPNSNSMHLSIFRERIYSQALDDLPKNKSLISCLNAHSFNLLQKDTQFQYAIQSSNVILPDGIAIVYALRFLTGIKLKKISGHMLFHYQMERLNSKSGRCFFLGSTDITNYLIKKRGAIDYPNVVIASYSPPFKGEFSNEDTHRMIEAVNSFKPDVLFIGMTAPKQEKWAATNFRLLKARHICCIGAVFNFYAGNTKCPPLWIIKLGLEWLFRLLCEPRRLWRRYILGNPQFVALILAEKINLLKCRIANSPVLNLFSKQ